MTWRSGLQAKMTASYVVITAGTVLVAGCVLIVTAALSAATVVSVPELKQRAAATAQSLAKQLAYDYETYGKVPPVDLGNPAVADTSSQAELAGGGLIAIPQIAAGVCKAEPSSFAVAVSMQQPRQVLATSYPACFSVGTAGYGGDAGALRKTIADLPAVIGQAGLTSLPAGVVISASAPVLDSSRARTPVGIVYVEIPAIPVKGTGSLSVPPALLWTGAGALAASIPLGIAFGMLSTRRLIRRLRALTSTTLAVASGEFGSRIRVSGSDEVAQLEENFNAMASRLSDAVAAERRLAAANARHHERSRIARELHDSISQELFSLSVLSGGLRRSLPAGSPVLPAVETMERTAGDTMREMQALLLELQPVALGEAGLSAALDGICRAHRERLGLDVRAAVSSVVLPAQVEHAILRIAQEAMANSVRHSGASVIRLRLSDSGPDGVTLEVSDDGSGFDVRAGGSGGLGLRAMRERVDELGGSLSISSGADGTVVRAVFPVRVPS
jgi:signal transduction histidine kinase